MSLLDFFDDDLNEPYNKVQTKKEKIRQLRAQMLIHSYLYYELDNIIWSDERWQEKANELAELQKNNPEIGFYDEAFKDWNGSTGMDLPKDHWIVDRANELLGKKKGSLN